MSYYKIKDLENYFKMYKKSVREPRKFWDRIADENFTWYQKWDKVFENDMQEASFKWFLNELKSFFPKTFQKLSTFFSF